MSDVYETVEIKKVKCEGCGQEIVVDLNFNSKTKSAGTYLVSPGNDKLKSCCETVWQNISDEHFAKYRVGPERNIKQDTLGYADFNRRMNVEVIFRIEDVTRQISSIYEQLQEISAVAGKLKEEANRKFRGED